MCGGGGGGKVQETALEREQAAIAADKWDRYQSKYRNTENQLIKKVMSYGTKEDRDKTVGDSVLAMRQAQGAEKVNPNEGLSGSKSIVKAMNLAGSATSGESASRRRKSAGLQSVVDLGAGIDRGAIQGISRQANMESQLARSNAIQEAQDDADTMGAIGTLGGVAIGKGMNSGWFGGGAT
jgi:hypothetical protein